MSKIPNFGFRSKLKAPTVLKARTANGEKNEAVNVNPRTTQDAQPANAKQEEPVSYTTRHEENGIDDTNDEECSSDNENRNNNVILRSSAPRENLEHTSNNLSKLADKLNASKQASGIPNKIASKSAFRRKGSSNIAKLNTGRDKERSGSTQIHGQTPYSKSPKPESKPPLGARRSGTEAPVNKQTRLSRISAIPGGIKKTFLRKDDENEIDHVNETVSLPSKKQKAEDDSSTAEIKGKTAAAVRRPPGSGLLRSGIRPPSGTFTGIGIPTSVPRADTRMKAPSVPSSRVAVNLKSGESGMDGKVVLRKNSGQDTTIVKRNSGENLPSSGLATPRQRQPSKELQTMAEKLKSYSGTRLQRPISVCSESDLRKSALKSEAQGKRRSVLPTNLRTMNSSSLQEIYRKDSNQGARKSTHRRTGSYDKNATVDNSSSLFSCKTSNTRQADEIEDGIVAVHKSKGLVRPRPRMSTKTLSSANSELGVRETLSDEPFQSTPVDKTRVMSTGEHHFASALSATMSGVFEDGCDIDVTDHGPSKESCRRDLHKTFTDDEHNRTYVVPTTQDAPCTDNGLKQNQLNVTMNRDDLPGNQLKANVTFDHPKMTTNEDGVSNKQPNANVTFEIDKGDEPSLHTDGSFDGSDGKSITSQEVQHINEGSASSKENLDKCQTGTLQISATAGLDAILDGYCSDNFLVNESMPTLDGSFATSLTDDLVLSSPKSDSDIQVLNARQSHDQNEVNGDDVTGDSQQQKSASKELKFDGMPHSEERLVTHDDVLATSLIDDSYDVVTSDEVAGCIEGAGNVTCRDLAPTKNDSPEYVGEISGVSKDIKNEVIDSEEKSNSRENLDENDHKKGEPCKKENEMHLVKESGDQEGTCSKGSAEENNFDGKDVSHRFQIPLPVRQSQSCEEKCTHGIEAKERNFSSLLSQTVENFLNCDCNSKSDPPANLPTPEGSVEAVIDALSSLTSNTSQMKIAPRRRSLVRRNTSPYVTSVPGLPTSGTSFRMPKEVSITETEDGNVIMDEGTYMHCQNDVRIIKTNLLRLKRVLQELDIVSPFVKHQDQYANSAPGTPTRPVVLGRSFSDASCWLAKVKKKSMDSIASTEKLSNPSLNKTDEDKVKDEILDLKQKQAALERELEEAKHDLMAKENTIKLLQTQLENEEYLEQIELLTEEKIILFEENQELKERIEELESQFPDRSPFVRRTGIYRITTNYGMSFIGSCNKPGFHPHPKEPPLFEDSEHVHMDNSMGLKIVDLR